MRTYIYIYIYNYTDTYICVYNIYMYICRERGFTCVYVYKYICICNACISSVYIYVYVENAYIVSLWTRPTTLIHEPGSTQSNLSATIPSTMLCKSTRMSCSSFAYIYLCDCLLLSPNFKITSKKSLNPKPPPSHPLVFPCIPTSLSLGPLHLALNSAA